MNKNDIVRVKITDIGTDGEGIGKADGFTLFVNNTAPGDVIDARILKAKKTYAYAKVEKLIEAAESRVDPACPVADKCGGCTIQHLSYESQLELKSKKVFDCLTRIGGLDAEELKDKFEPIIGMDDPWNYRNKAQYPIGKDKNGNPTIGFYAYHSHNIIENDFCKIQNPCCSFIIKALREVISKFNILPYDEMEQKGTIRHCLIRVGAATGEVMVCIVINAAGKELRNWSDTAPQMIELKERFEKAVSEFNKSDEKEPGDP
ncbi:MAG: 23S rRNA (uracil(1939)-C(5))-methyltransferase RlmD, partial [Lachnospiraceae bacterium]|nr:23S rRNA (uracil(1939)-C(5))-methyltransferase RlmD [Lachnospiraceae bacterium]